jgi:hypothetical protein
VHFLKQKPQKTAIFPPDTPVHTGKVTGSIPVSPTIPLPKILQLFIRVFFGGRRAFTVIAGMCCECPENWA